MTSQLELQKPPAPGKATYWNIPLLSSIGLVVAGLGIIFTALVEETMLLVLVCAGPGLVMLGVTSMLIRVLFTNTPTVLVRGVGRLVEGEGKKYKIQRERIDDSIDKKSRSVSNKIKEIEEKRQREAEDKCQKKIKETPVSEVVIHATNLK